MVKRSLCAFAAGLLLACPAASAQTPAPPSHNPGTPSHTQEPARITSVTEEVLLDLVARDKKGRPVRDLRPEEVRVFEDGKLQTLRGFRFVQSDLPAPAGAAPPQTLTARTDGTPVKIERHINLVSLVFERLNNESRLLARDGALEFLKNELTENTLVGVFGLDQNLYLLQQFTNDRQELRTAILKATGGAYSQFPSQSDEVKQQLQTMTSSQEQAQSAAGSITRGNTGGAGAIGAASASAQIAQMQLDILQYSEEMSRLEQGRSSIFGLLALIREQGRLMGRKTVVYFSEGLIVPPNLVEYFRATIGAANRNNVSFYAVDARGLLSQRANQAGVDAMAGAARANTAQVYSGDRHSITREEVMSSETVEAAIRMNTQETLANISYATGGFPIANTNDLRLGMREVADDIRGYYELTYQPPGASYDGKFRAIKVEVLRPGVTVQSRSGYFALPPVAAAAAMLPYEAQMLGALNSQPLPQQLEFRAQALHFGDGADGVEHAIVIQAPLGEFQFDQDARAKQYRGALSVMGLVKDAEGRVVRKVSENYPLEGPLEKLDSLRRGEIVFARNVRLKPGRYTLETIVYDRTTQKAGARRTVLMVPPPPPGVRMSSLALIRRADPVAAASEAGDDPFLFQNVRVVPNLGEAVRLGSSGLPLFVVVYPSAAIAEKPHLSLECLHDGVVVANALLPLPAPDAHGRIAFAGAIPIEKLAPGDYQLHAVVRQGTSAAQEFALFSVTR